MTTWRWDFGDGTSSTEQHPTHEYTKAGAHSVRLTVSGPGGSNTVARPDLITVRPGPAASMSIEPPTASLQVRGSVQFTAAIKDLHGNAVTASPSWTLVGGGGAIDASGVFTAGTVAGPFPNTVRARVQGATGPVEAAASVTLRPGPLARVTISPAQATLDIGTSQAFTAQVADQFGNAISGALVSWNVSGAVGTLDATQVFTAGTKAGAFPGAIRVDVVQETARASATADVSILPAPLATIDVRPSSFVALETGVTQKFEATGFDQYKNELPGLAFLWETTGGTITQAGLYTANRSGSHQVTASATFKGGQRTGTAAVDVPLYAWWQGEGNANDAAGGHHGALRNGATFAPGKVGQAFSLPLNDTWPGNGAHIEVVSGNDDFHFAPRLAMTVSMWVKRTSPAGPLPSGVSLHLLGKRLTCSPVFDYHFQIYYDSNTWGFAVDGSGIGQRTADVDLLPFGQWRHLAVTFDGFVFNLYVDVVLKRGPNLGNFASPPNNAPLLIGGSGGCPTFIGLMDEVKFFKRALTEAEIKAIFDSGR